MEKKVKAVKLITIFSVVVICIATIILTCQIIKISNLKSKEKKLSTERDYLISEIYNYNTANTYYSNNREEFLEKYARDILGWGENGEVWYKKG